MTIEVLCACGKILKARKEHAGKRTRCPACGQPLTVPAAPTDGLELDLDAGPPETLRCPVCQQVYPESAGLCGTCGIDLRTGLPAGPAGGSGVPGAAAPRRAGGRVISTREEEPDPDEVGFATLLWWTVVRPVATMEQILAYLGRTDMLVKMGVCYLASLVVVGALGGLGFTAVGKSKPVTDAPPVGATAAGILGVGEVPTFEGETKRQPLGRLELDFRTLPAQPAANAPLDLRYTVRLAETGEPYTKGFEGIVVRDVAGDEHGHLAFDGDLTMVKEGEFQAQAEIGPPGRYRSDLTLIQAGDLPDLHFSHYFVVPERALDAARGVARKAPFAVAGAIVWTLMSLLMLLFDAVTLNVAARFVGGGGGFVPMLVVLAYLSGIVNFAKVAVLAVGVGAGGEAALWADRGFGVWNYVLYILALMKVYDLELGWALGATLLAGILRMWLMMALAGALFAAFGVMM